MIQGYRSVLVWRADEKTPSLNIGAVDSNRGYIGIVGGRGFSCLSFLASDKSLELVGELFALFNWGPLGRVRGGNIFWNRFKFRHGHFEGNVGRTGIGGRRMIRRQWNGVPDL